MKLDVAGLRGIAGKARSRALEVARTPALRWQAVGLLGVTFVLARALATLFDPFFTNGSRFGFHDWDAASAFRYLTVLSVTRFHELPLWHPWVCGGVPAWAAAEGATNFVSPFFPLYLVLPLQLAERLEVVLSTIAAFGFTYLLAGRVTKSAALRGLVAFAYAFNGRWVMQLAEGHVWHLALAWVPLALYLFDVSLEEGKAARRAHAIGAGGVLAAIVYTGGAYPLAETLLLLVTYGLIRAATGRMATPFYSLVIAGATGAGFAAPKLLPMLDLMSRLPKKVDSTEAVGMGPLISVFTDAIGTVDRPPIGLNVPGHLWVDYGIYVGFWLTGALILSVLMMTAKGRVGALRATGILFLLLGCGAFFKYAPWTFVHDWPFFSTLQFPSRFLPIAVLLLMLAFAGVIGGALERPLARRPWIDLLLLLPVYFVAMSLARVGFESTRDTFSLQVPGITPSGAFHQVGQLGSKYVPDAHDSGTQELLAMYANTGVLHCSTATELPIGAVGQGDATYQGEGYVVGTHGATARVTAWSPNAATIHYDGAEAGSSLVYNMNFDPSWRANGSPTTSYKGAIATPLTERSGDVTFRYYPRAMTWGILVFWLTAFLAFGGPREVTEWWGKRGARG